jgi:glycosyltransferase involved in cell wall biosynthesis
VTARVGLVTTSYPRTTGDAAGGFVAAHAEALAARGLAVEVVAAGAGSAPRDATSAIPIARVPGDGLFYAGGAPDLLEGGAGRLAAMRFTARLTLAVARRAARWDRVIAHWLAPSALAALASRGPLLAIAHGGDVHTLRRLHLLGPTLALLRRRDARLAFVSADLLDLARAVADRATDRWLDRAALIQPMGLDLARFAALAARRDLAAPRPIVLCLARLVPLKGVDVALAALAHLRTPVELVIAGDGPEAARLAAIRTDPRHLVTLRGEVSTDERDELLRRAAALVIPSRPSPTGRTEGTPLAALEALAAGVPVVASRLGGLAALPLHHVTPERPAELAAALDQVLGSPPPPAGLPGAVADLDWPKVAGRLETHARV